MSIDKILNINQNDLDKIDTSYINQYNLSNDTFHFHFPSGKEHYRLLTYISTLFNNITIFDVGTNKCLSALALSYNKNNKIKSYDIMQILPENPKISNVEFILGNCIDDNDIKTCPFIFLDVDHDGKYEKVFYDYLLSINWKGFLLLDDIYLNDSMKTYWNSFVEEKYDLTHVGHWSGTGLVYFKQ